MAEVINRQPLVLQNGIYLTTSSYGGESLHPDSAHVQVMNGGKEESTYLGVIAQYATTGFKNQGNIWDFALQGAKSLSVDTNLWEWDLPTTTEDFMILEDLSGSATPGIDGQTFKLRVNKRGAGNSATVKFDRFSTVELSVTDDPIIQDGRSWVMTFRLATTNGAEKFVPKQLLTQGTRLIVNSSHFGEFDTVWNDGGVIPRSAMSRFYQYVGQTDANISHSITDRAAMSTVSSKAMYSLEQYRKLIEMWVFKPGSDAFDYSMGKTLSGKDPIKYVYGGGEAGKEKARRDLMLTKWVPEVEALCMARLKLDQENEALFGTGGQIVKENNTYNRPIGAFFQLNKGYKHFYNVGNITWERFNAILTSRFKDRIEPFGGNVIRIYTGWGGIRQADRMIGAQPSQYGMVIDSDPYIQGKSNTGANNNLTFNRPYYRSAMTDIGMVEFVYKPSFDPVQANELENPIVNGFRLSSYLYMIVDITGQNDSIYEIKYRPEDEFRWFFENGKMDYMGKKTGFHGKLNAEYAFRVAMLLRHKAYWVSDPTRAFMLIPYNPFTGVPFAQDYMEYLTQATEDFNLLTT